MFKKILAGVVGIASALTLSFAPVVNFSEPTFAAENCLIQTIDTSVWSPPSPDPSGIVYVPASGRFLVVDGEVEEMPIFAGVNGYETSSAGALLATHSTTNFSNEPVGIGYNPDNGHFYIADDNDHKIFDADLGLDQTLGTADDIVTSFSTTGLGAGEDPEGVTYGAGILYVAGGSGNKIYRIDPGVNGVFEAGGDDVISSFDSAALGAQDPEGVVYNPDNNSLFVVSTKGVVIETSTTGTLLRTIDLKPYGVDKTSDAAYAPSSTNPAVFSLYVTERGVDNNADPNENDGKIYEFSLDPSCISPSILKNGSFEADANADNKPDNWTLNAKFTRSQDLAQTGQYSGKFLINDNTGATITQTVKNLTGGTTFNYSGFVNIPPLSDTIFSITLDVVWKNSSGSTLGTSVVKTYTSATSDWDLASASLTSPAGTTKATVRMVVKKLNGTIYVDNLNLTPQ